MERESPRRDQGVSWGLGDAACSAPQVQCLAHCCSGKAVKKTDKTLPSRSLNPGGRELQPSGSAPYVLEMFPLPLNHHPALPGSAFCMCVGGRPSHRARPPWPGCHRCYPVSEASYRPLFQQRVSCSALEHHPSLDTHSQAPILIFQLSLSSPGEGAPPGLPRPHPPPFWKPGRGALPLWSSLEQGEG